jgi:small-conductance mechanosensitive channel
MNKRREEYMERVIKRKIIILWVVGMILYGVVFSFFVEYLTNGFFKDMPQLLIVPLLALMAVLYVQLLTNATIKLFQGRKYERINLLDKNVRPFLIVLASLILFVTMLMIILTKDKYTVSMVIVVVLYYHAFMKVVYVSDDMLIYNNNVLRIGKIDKYEKRKKFFRVSYSLLD